MPDCRQRFDLVLRRARIERIGFGLEPLAGQVDGAVDVALRDQPLGPDGPRRLQQVVGALGPKPVGEREHAVEVPEALDARKASRLMDYHLWLRPPGRIEDRPRSSRSAGAAYAPMSRSSRILRSVRVSAGTSWPDYDEPGYQPGADRAAGTSDSRLSFAPCLRLDLRPRDEAPVGSVTAGPPTPEAPSRASLSPQLLGAAATPAGSPGSTWSPCTGRGRWELAGGDL